MFVSRKRHMREIAAWRSRASEYLAGADEARAALQKVASLLDAGETPSVTVRRIDVLLDRLGIFRPLNDAAQRWTLRDLWSSRTTSHHPGEFRMVRKMIAEGSPVWNGYSVMVECYRNPVREYPPMHVGSSGAGMILNLTEARALRDALSAWIAENEEENDG